MDNHRNARECHVTSHHWSSNCAQQLCSLTSSVHQYIWEPEWRSLTVGIVQSSSTRITRGFCFKCVLPVSFVAWRPRSEPWRATPEVARANHDGCVAMPLAATASQHARHVHGDPDCPALVHEHCDGLLRCVAHSVHLRRFSSASLHPSFGLAVIPQSI